MKTAAALVLGDLGKENDMSDDVEVVVGAEKVTIAPRIEYGYVRVYNTANGMVVERVGSDALVLGLIEYAHIAVRFETIQGMSPKKEEPESEQP